MGLVVGISVGDTTLGTTIGNLGFTEVRFANPVFHGDTLCAITRINRERPSKSRPNTGLVVFEHLGFNQLDQEVVYCLRTGLMKKSA